MECKLLSNKPLPCDFAVSCSLPCPHTPSFSSFPQKEQLIPEQMIQACFHRLGLRMPPLSGFPSWLSLPGWDPIAASFPLPLLTLCEVYFLRLWTFWIQSWLHLKAWWWGWMPGVGEGIKQSQGGEKHWAWALLTKQRGDSIKKKSMLISHSLWDPGDGGSIASVGCSRRGGMYEGTTIPPWQQSGLESSLAVLPPFLLYICLCR